MTDIEYCVVATHGERSRIEKSIIVHFFSIVIIDAKTHCSKYVNIVFHVPATVSDLELGRQADRADLLENYLPVVCSYRNSI